MFLNAWRRRAYQLGVQMFLAWQGAVEKRNPAGKGTTVAEKAWLMGWDVLGRVVQDPMGRYGWLVVEEEGLKLRAAPGLRGKVKGKVTVGSIVLWTGKVVRADGYVWFEVATRRGRGWVAWKPARRDARPWMVPVVRVQRPRVPLKIRQVANQDSTHYGTGQAWPYTSPGKAKQSFSFADLARDMGLDKHYPKDRVHYNLCGPLTVAYLLDEKVLSALYVWWQELGLPFDGRFKGDLTGADDLATMFQAYGYGVVRGSLEEGIAMLKARVPVAMVVGVNLRKDTGYLGPKAGDGKDIPHWSALVGVVEDGRVYVYLPHEGRVVTMSEKELLEREWAPGGKKVVIIAPELSKTTAYKVKDKKDLSSLQKTGERLVLIYNPYENRYEVMTEGYFKRSRDLGDGVLMAYPLEAGGGR